MAPTHTPDRCTGGHLEQLTAENRQGTVSMSGEILLRVGERNVLIEGN